MRKSNFLVVYCILTRSKGLTVNSKLSLSLVVVSGLVTSSRKEQHKSKMNLVGFEHFMLIIIHNQVCITMSATLEVFLLNGNQCHAC